MQTRPVIIPWTAPITELFLYTIMSIETHTKRLVATQRWVLTMARAAISFAANGDPPLKPVQSSHRNPAPPNVWIMLFGGKFCLSCECVGPTYIYISSSSSQSWNHDIFKKKRTNFVFKQKNAISSIHILKKNICVVVDERNRFIVYLHGKRKKNDSRAEQNVVSIVGQF